MGALCKQGPEIKCISHPACMLAGWPRASVCLDQCGSIWVHGERPRLSVGTWRRASTSSEWAPQGGVSWRKPEPAGLRALSGMMAVCVYAGCPDTGPRLVLTHPEAGRSLEGALCPLLSWGLPHCQQWGPSVILASRAEPKHANQEQ